MALTADEIDQLYVAPGWTGHGIGGRLLSTAKARRPDGLGLYTFQVNAGARRFYERHGFVVVALGDGSSNEEGQPDVRYAWRPRARRRRDKTSEAPTAPPLRAAGAPAARFSGGGSPGRPRCAP
jgi:predicted N-acetyltransferase YhbS